jgi:hypothetical protein
VEKINQQMIVEIDGVKVQPEIVSPLFQKDPFPVGHQFGLTISSYRETGYFSLEEGDLEYPEKVVVSRFFTYLSIWTGKYVRDNDMILIGSSSDTEQF